MSEEVLKDMLSYGVHITKGGERVRPEDFYEKLPDFDAIRQQVINVEDAAKLYRTDPRFRMLADSVVAHARANYGPLDPEDDNGSVLRIAAEIATQAVALALARVYVGDAEISALRHERDRYRALALRGLEISPPNPIIIPAQSSKAQPK